MADLQFLFPGHPFVRGPSSKGGGKKPYKPVEYTPNAFYEFFDYVDRNNPTEIPAWLWKMELDNIKGAFKAEIPKSEGISVTAEDRADFSQEEFEELPGAAGFTVNLNPVDWVSDPVKQINKFFTDSVNAVADYDDFRQRVKESMWGNQGDFTTDVNSPFYMAGKKDDPSGSRSNPFDPTAATNPYTDVQTKVSDFMAHSKASSKRNSKYRAASLSVANALDSELTHLRTGGAGAMLFNAADAAVLERFNAQLNVANNLVKLDKAMEKVEENFSIKFFSTEKKAKKGAPPGTPYEVDTAYEVLGNELNNVKSAISHARSINAFGGEMAGVESYVTRLEKKLAPHTDVVGGVYRISATAPGANAAIYQAIHVEKTRLFRATADEGVGGKFVTRVVKKNLHNKSSDLNKVIDNNGGVISTPGKNAGNLVRVVNRDYDWQTSVDLVNAFDDGDLAKQYIWRNLIRPRIERWTPSYWLKRGLEKTNYLGLTAQVFENSWKMNLPAVGTVRIAGGDQFSLSVNTITHMLDGSAPGDPNRLFRILNGTILPTDNLTAEEITNVSKLLAYLKRNENALGLNFTGNVLNTAPGNKATLEALLKDIKMRRLGGGHVNPELVKASILGKYTAFLTRFQQNTLVKVYRVTLKLPEVVFQKLMTALGRVLEVVLGTATEGVGLIIAWIARLLLAKFFKAVTKALTEAYKGLKKGDLSVVFEGIESAGIVIIKVSLWIIGAIILIPVLVLFFMGIIIVSIQNFDSTKVGGNVIGESQVEVVENAASDSGGGNP